MKPQPYAALLGDLVGSRTSADRGALHRRLLLALDAANAGADVLDPVRVTAGDEFQGAFATVGGALAATFTLRARLRPAQARFGLGVGSVEVVDATDNIQDGSAWWAARAAIEATERAARGARRALRTGVAAAADQPAPDPALLAALALVDAALFDLDDHNAAILAGLREGTPQARIARRLDISPSAVSQRVARSGLAILAEAMTRLEEVP